MLDTNVVLDMLVFEDATIGSLQVALRDRSVVWLVTGAMRLELARVLAYPVIATRLAASTRAAGDVLARFDQLSQWVPDALAAPVRCTDRDDQMFIDLAVAHRAFLLSKDRQVLRLRKRLALLGVTVQSAAGMPRDGLLRSPAA